MVTMDSAALPNAQLQSAKWSNYDKIETLPKSNIYPKYIPFLPFRQLLDDVSMLVT